MPARATKATKATKAKGSLVGMGGGAIALSLMAHAMAFVTLWTTGTWRIGPDSLHASRETALEPSVTEIAAPEPETPLAAPSSTSSACATVAEPTATVRTTPRARVEAVTRSAAPPRAAPAIAAPITQTASNEPATDVAAIAEVANGTSPTTRAAAPTQGTAAPVAGDPNAGPRYLASVRERLMRSMQFPADAAGEGTVVLRLVLRENGELFSATVDGGDDDRALRKAALTGASRSAPFPAVPRELGPQALHAFRIPVRFTYAHPK